MRTPAQAAEAVGVSLPRYYLLEQRAIGASVASCEPAPRGPQLSNQLRIAALEREIARLKREAAMWPGTLNAFAILVPTARQWQEWSQLRATGRMAELADAQDLKSEK